MEDIQQCVGREFLVALRMKMQQLKVDREILWEDHRMDMYQLLQDMLQTLLALKGKRPRVV